MFNLLLVGENRDCRCAGPNRHEVKNERDSILYLRFLGSLAVATQDSRPSARMISASNKNPASLAYLRCVLNAAAFAVSDHILSSRVRAEVVAEQQRTPMFDNPAAVVITCS